MITQIASALEILIAFLVLVAIGAAGIRLVSLRLELFLLSENFCLCRPLVHIFRLTPQVRKTYRVIQ